VDTPLEQSLPFRVTVLEGPLSTAVLQTGQAPGVISLEGRALPKGSISFESVQRTRDEWYGGNPEATLQTFGAKKMPTTVSGEWKDRFLGDGTARALHAVFESILDRGPLLEVSWGAGALASGDALAIGDPFTRRGVLYRGKFTYEIPQRCMWEMEFKWRGGAVLSAPAATVTDVLATAAGVQDVAESLSRLEAFAGAFGELTQNLLVGAPARVLQNIDAALASVNAAADSVAQAGRAAQTAASLPAQVAGHLVGTLANGIDAAKAVIDVFETFPAVTSAVKDSALDALEMVSNIVTILGLARDAQHACASAADGVGQANSPDVIAEDRVPAGTDLRVLSAKWYDGDPDGWEEIANYNNLPTSEVPAPPTGPADTDWPTIKIPRRGLALSLAGGC